MMEVLRRELLVLLAATCILALVLLPGLLVRARAEEVAASPGPRAAPLSGGPGRDLLVRDPVYSLEGAEGDFWRRDAQEKLARDVRRKVVEGRARNIIFFLGDGMGVSTLTAARWSWQTWNLSHTLHGHIFWYKISPQLMHDLRFVIVNTTIGFPISYLIFHLYLP